MVDLRTLNAIQEEQKQQQLQSSPIMQKVVESAQQQQQLPEELQSMVDYVAEQREREAVNHRLATYYNALRQQYACGGCVRHGDGGSIHIDPSKRGTFTAAASRHGMGVQEFASHVHAHPENYSPEMRRKANFARNAAKWHHAYGGPMSHQDGMIKSILDKYLTNYRITSGYRGQNNKVGKLGKGSAHARLLDDGSSAALDIVADDMNRLREELANPALQRELAAAGFGILDETDPATMKKTGATGAHFHIGEGIKGGGFHLNGYGHQPVEYSAQYGGAYLAQEPILISGSSGQQAQFSPWWEQQAMTDADMGALYASAAGGTAQPENTDFSAFNLSWNPSGSGYPNLFAKGGYTSSPAIRNQIAAWEGSSMYKPAPDTEKVNRPFSAEERDFWNAIPDDVKPYLTQDMADALFSTSYNIGAGNFKKRVVPKLRSVLVDGIGTVDDITNAMYGTRDSEPKMQGLRTRRAKERQMFADAYNIAYGSGSARMPPYIAPIGYGNYEPIALSQSESNHDAFTPWWQRQQNGITPDYMDALYTYAAGQGMPDVTPDFAQFQLRWDPVTGSHSNESSSSFPRLFAVGGHLIPINVFDGINGGSYIRNYHFAPLSENGVEYANAFDGRPLHEGDNVWYDDHNRLVTADRQNALADYAQYLGMDFSAPKSLQNIVVTAFNKNGKYEPRGYTEDEFRKQYIENRLEDIIPNPELREGLKAYINDNIQDTDTLGTYNRLLNVLNAGNKPPTFAFNPVPTDWRATNITPYVVTSHINERFPVSGLTGISNLVPDILIEREQKPYYTGRSMFDELGHWWQYNPSINNGHRFSDNDNWSLLTGNPSDIIMDHSGKDSYGTPGAFEHSAHIGHNPMIGSYVFNTTPEHFLRKMAKPGYWHKLDPVWYEQNNSMYQDTIKSIPQLIQYSDSVSRSLANYGQRQHDNYWNDRKRLDAIHQFGW